jgi:hypothetical protein
LISGWIIKYKIAKIKVPTRRYDELVSGERLLMLTAEKARSKRTNTI